MDFEEPPEEAYGRVTDAERYRPLHAAAEALLDDLEHRFVARRDEGMDLDGFLSDGGSPRRMVRLTPDGGGAPMTLAFTSFPGLSVLAGWADWSTYPHCGCDACDEDPIDLARDLRERATRIATGGLIEQRSHRIGGLGRDRYTIRIADESGESAAPGTVEPGDVADRVPRDTTMWPPWRLRPSG